MRKVKKPLNPSSPDWEKQVTSLRIRLNLAVNYYSGLAQPPRSPTASIAAAMKKSSDRMSREIRDVVLDIACALHAESDRGWPGAGTLG